MPEPWPDATYAGNSWFYRSVRFEGPNVTSFTTQLLIFPAKVHEHLLENDHIDGDLLMVAAAYNGGPGNLRKWQNRARKGAYTDALMFIESIPAAKPIFAERVLSNLWMYRERLGEPAPSLDALAVKTTNPCRC